MLVQDQYQLDSPLFDNTSFIPANYNHFKFNLTSEHHLNIPEGMYIIPFKDHSVTFEELLKELLKMVNIEKQYKLEKIKLSLKSGYIVDHSKTAEQLRVQLCRDSASGITLQAKIMGNIMDEAAVVFHIANEPDFDKQRFNKWFVLLNNQTPFYISIVKTIEYEKLREAIAEALNYEYKNGIKKDHISFYKVNKTNEEIVLNWEIDGQILSKKQVSQMIKIQTNTIIGVEVTKEDADWPQSNVTSEEYLIFHISNQSQIKLRFSQIANYTVEKLLRYLKIEHKNTLGIKIVDEIFAPHQLIKDASGYFKSGQGTFVKNIECRLVSEKEMFYSEMNKINEEFYIKKEMVTKQKEAQFEKCRQKCRDLIQRLNQQSEIKEEKEVSAITVVAPNPITLYTSSVEVIDPQSHSSNLLYRCLNDQLRTVSFGTNQELVKSWKYKFAATLIKSLNQTTKYEGLVYRGIRGHQLIGNVNQLYVAKEFMSTSKIQSKAQNFTKQAIPNIGTMVTIKSLTGREIKQYSMYEKEDQVLFMPYTYFRIIKKDESGPIYKMTLEELQEKEFKCNPSIEILWVDDKVKEGEKVISLLNCPMYTTFFKQLHSTQQLAEWIKANPSKIANPAIKKIIISNMRRIENEVEVLDAGAQTVKLARKEIPNCQIVLYIGHVEGTKQKLIQNNIDVNSVLILSKRQHLREYIAKACAPPENEEKAEEVIFETQSTVLKFFEPINSKVSSQSQEN